MCKVFWAAFSGCPFLFYSRYFFINIKIFRLLFLVIWLLSVILGNTIHYVMEKI